MLRSDRRMLEERGSAYARSWVKEYSIRSGIQKKLGPSARVYRVFYVEWEIVDLKSLNMARGCDMYILDYSH